MYMYICICICIYVCTYIYTSLCPHACGYVSGWASAPTPPASIVMMPYYIMLCYVKV